MYYTIGKYCNVPTNMCIHTKQSSVNIKGNVAVYKDLKLEFVTKNSFCHEFAARKFELSHAKRARSIVNCILSLFCRLYLLGELSKDGQVSIMW